MSDILEKNAGIFKNDLEIEKKLKKIIDQGTAENTKKAYRKDLAYFKTWMEISQGQSFHPPISIETILAFIAEHLEGLPKHIDQELVDKKVKSKLGAHKLTTVKRRIASISAFHEMKGLDNPTRDQVVKKVLSKASRALKGQRSKSNAITKDILEKILNQCSNDLRGMRNAAIVAVGFSSGGRRRSEIAQIKREDLQKVEGGYLLNLTHSKTDQEGIGLSLPILGLAGRLLEAYLEAIKIEEGSIFRAIRKGSDKLEEKAISAKSVNNIVKKLIAKAGYDSKKFSAHGLRSGFITECGKNGITLGDTMALSGHKTVSVALSYYEAGNVLNNPAGNLL